MSKTNITLLSELPEASAATLTHKALKIEHLFLCVTLKVCFLVMLYVSVRQSLAFDIERNTPLYVIGASQESHATQALIYNMWV